MLPADHRMRRREDFSLAVRRGRRAGSQLLVAHVLTSAPMGTDPMSSSATTSSFEHQPTPQPARVGFVVSKAVGGAVQRNQVRRRLRALLASRLPLLPAGALVVVRANAPAAHASSEELGRCLDRVLGRLLAPRVTT